MILGTIVKFPSLGDGGTLFDLRFDPEREMGEEDLPRGARGLDFDIVPRV